MYILAIKYKLDLKSEINIKLKAPEVKYILYLKN